MPVSGLIDRLAAKSMVGANQEEIEKDFDSLVSQSEDQTFALRQAEKRRQLEERAIREKKLIVYVPKEQFYNFDPARIVAQEEQYNCVMIPIDEHELQKKKKSANKIVSFDDPLCVASLPTMPPELPDIKMLTPAVYDVPHVKGGRYHEPTRDLRKKKKAKRRQQKQARRRNK